MRNQEKAEYLLRNALMFDYNLEKYSYSQIRKLQTLSKDINSDVLIELFDNFNYEHITKHNWKNLLSYLNDFDNKLSDVLTSDNNLSPMGVNVSHRSVLTSDNSFNVEWGSGNHKSKKENVNAHYTKHVLSSEGDHWANLISKDKQSYERYAIDSFNKLKKVLVHTDGKNIYISGFLGNIFTIGRYYGDKFKLSSCYYVESGEKMGRYKGILKNL
jgi:hypothetical protein